MQTTKSLDASLVELSRGEYASTIVMPHKNYIFNNWTKHYICGDYYVVNKQTHWNKYAMPLQMEIFDMLGQAKVFNTLDLQSSYHQLPLRKGTRSRQHFGGLIFIGNIVCTNRGFFNLVWKKSSPITKDNGLSIDNFRFAKCYIDDIIVFSLTPWGHIHHL